MPSPLDRRIAHLETVRADSPTPPTIVPIMTPAQAADAYAATIRWTGSCPIRAAPGDALTPDQAAAAYAALIQSDRSLAAPPNTTETTTLSNAQIGVATGVTH